jgi:anthranilate synthase/aminodeoxychorismate synthase-like glutamine amidotransferase
MKERGKRREAVIIDNYDSFTYNLADEVGRQGIQLRVVRNDAPELDELLSEPPAALVLSPGPGSPQRAGRSIELIKALRDRCPILGVCLGHQAIGLAYGGSVSRGAVVHGQATMVEHADHRLFAGVPKRFAAGRYHSLHVDADLPHDLVQIAAGDDGAVMAIADRNRPVFGLQFHPESILTKHGPRILENFLAIAGLAS